MRVETNKQKFAVRYLRIEAMANSGHKEAQKFLRVYGHGGTHSSPAEWCRAYVLDFPTSSVSLERHHREIKRVMCHFKPLHVYKVLITPHFTQLTRHI